MSDKNKMKYEIFAQQSKSELSKNKQHIVTLQSHLSNNINQNRYIYIAIVTHQIKEVDLLFKLNDHYNELLKRNNDSILEDIRKNFSTLLAELKTCFDIGVHSDFIKNEDPLVDIVVITPKRLLNLLTSMEKNCTKLRIAYGPTSKYNKTMLNIYEDVCGFTINVINLKKYLSLVRDLSNPAYSSIRNLLDFSSEILEKTVDLYMETYKVTLDEGLISRGIIILESLETVYRLSNLDEELEDTTRKKQAWERLLNHK